MYVSLSDETKAELHKRYGFKVEPTKMEEKNGGVLTTYKAIIKKNVDNQERIITLFEFQMHSFVSKEYKRTWKIIGLVVNKKLENTHIEGFFDLLIEQLLDLIATGINPTNDNRIIPLYKRVTLMITFKEKAPFFEVLLNHGFTIRRSENVVGYYFGIKTLPKEEKENA